MAELSAEDKELYRLRTTGFWVSIAIGFIALKLVTGLGQPEWVAIVAALLVMMIAGRVLPWYREVQRREEGRRPPVISMLLTQGIAFITIQFLLESLWRMFTL